MSKLTAKPGSAYSLLWAVVMAPVLAYAMRSWEGLLVGALVGYLFAQVRHLRQTLDKVLGQLPASASDTERSAQAARETSRAPLTQTAAPPPSVSIARETEPEQTAGRASESAPASPTPKPTQAAAKSPERDGGAGLAAYFEQALAWLKGGNPLARVGIVVLFFGGAFLAKYSADQGLFPVEVRLAGLALGAIALIVLGWWLRDGRPVFAQLLQGGGIAGFYLTVFAAMRLFALLPPGLAFSLLVATAVAAAVLAVAENSQSLAFVGTVGGFLAPLLVSTGSADHVALFSYYTVLNLGVFALAWFRAWRALNLAAFFLTFGITGVFRATGYAAEKFLGTDFFLLLFFVLYVGISVLFSLRQKADLKGYVSGSLVFGLPVVVFSLQATLVARFEYALAWSALGFGVFYAALAWSLYVSRHDNLRLLCEAFAALAVIFASLTVPLAFDTQTTTAMWAIEGAGLLWLGVRQRRMLARGFGALLQLAGGLGYLCELDGLTSGAAVLNSAYVGTLMLSLGGLLSGYWLQREPDRLGKYESGAATLAGLWALGWWLFGGLSEIERTLAPAYDYGVVLLFGSVTALLLHGLCRRLAWQLLETAAGFILPSTVLYGLAFALFGHPAAELGAIAWPALAMAAYFLMYRLEQAQVPWLIAARPWPHAMSWWLLALLLCWESAWQIHRQVAGVWHLLPWGLIPALLLWTANRSPKLWPFNDHAETYRIHAAAPLAAWALLWILGINLNEGATGGLPYLPLLNPLDIGVGLVLTIVVHYWLGLEPPERRRVWPFELRSLWGAIAGLAFVWPTAALLRALHHLMGIPWDWQSMTDSFLVQTSLSVFWGILGILAIIVATRRGLRTVWIVGVALMAVVVVKLFAVDLAGTDTPARIVSFLTVGGLLLLAGYFAPLPPGERGAQASP